LTLMIPPPPRSPLFPYTTLFRSERAALLRVGHALVEASLGQADAERGDRDAAVVERLEELREPAAPFAEQVRLGDAAVGERELVDRKSTRLNSSHVKISYAVFCL